jgi:hypothetical protein
MAGRNPWIFFGQTVVRNDEAPAEGSRGFGSVDAGRRTFTVRERQRITPSERQRITPCERQTFTPCERR